MVTNRYIGGGGNDQVGTIIQYFGSNPPKGFLSCDGSIYNIVDYSRLANHIEGEFGSKNFFGGDGTTTFAVPDLRGEFLRGTGTNGATEISGSNVGYHQDGTKVPYVSIWSDSPSASMCQLYSDLYPGESINIAKDMDFSQMNRTGKGRAISYKSSIDIFDANNRRIKFIPRPTNTSVLYCIRW